LLFSLPGVPFWCKISSAQRAVGLLGGVIAMSRIFISHSSHDVAAASALVQWLSDQEPQLANEIFLDVDPVGGLRPGARWKRELFRQNSRCEAVICLLSKSWLTSHECKTEFRTAESLGKQILIARLADTGDTDITSEWQRCDLFGGTATTTIDVGNAPSVVFNTAGLTQLRDAIRGAGTGPENFVWPPRRDPERPPYRGWQPFEDIDAGVFFGRDAATVRGLDELRGMRNDGLKSLFVVLGPSGSGKSSFLRAGLVPRLQREDRHFLTLGVMRPQRAALTGTMGLAAAIDSARRALKLGGTPLGDIKTACMGDPERVAALLVELRTVAAERLLSSKRDAIAPTLVLPLDQAEELFAADAGPEADQFLALMVKMFGQLNANEVGLIVAASIRTDRFEVMQNHPALSGVNTVLFDELKPMPPTQFKEVIEGPARRTEDSEQPVHLAPDLVAQLLDDATRGADTLPLLSLTLARLYTDYGTEDELTLDHYTSLGGMRDVVNKEINEVLSADPEEKQRQLGMLRSAFIPWLATISPTNEPLRKAARYTDLPVDSRPLIDALIDKRLMVKDTRDGQVMVEVALESLLRQWDELAAWLAEERQHLQSADDIDHNTAAWAGSNKDPAWLLTGTRLNEAETLSASPAFGERMAGSRDYLAASRQAETDRERVEQERHEAELRAAKEHADTLRRRSRVLQAVLAVTAIVAVIALVASVLAFKARNLANERANDSRLLRDVSDAQFMLADKRPGGDVRALQQILAVNAVKPSDVVNNAMLDALIDRRRLMTVSDTGGDVAAVSSSGRGLVLGAADQPIRVLDANTGKAIGSPIAVKGRGTAAMSMDGRRVVAETSVGNLQAWDVDTGQSVGAPIRSFASLVATSDFEGDELGIWNVETGRPTTGNEVAAKMGAPATSLAFDQDGKRLATGFEDGTVQLWDTFTGNPIGPRIEAHAGEVTCLAFSGDGKRLATGSQDTTVRAFDVGTGKPVGAPMTSHRDWVRSVAMNRDGKMVVSGSDDRTAVVWFPDEGFERQLVGDHDSVTSVAFSPGGGKVFSGSPDKSLRVWNATDTSLGTSATTKHFQRNNELLIADLHLSALLAQNNLLREAMAEKTGQPFEPTVDRLKDKIGESVDLPASNNAFTHGGKYYAVADGAGAIHFFSTETDEQARKPLTGHDDTVFGLAFSTNNKLVSGGADETVRLWDVDASKEVRRYAADNHQLVRSVAISPDEHMIVAGYEDGTMRRWDADTGKPLGQLMTGHTRGVGALTFTPDGAHIVSGSDDKSLRVWDSATGQPVGDPLTGHSGAVYGVAVSPNGKEIASGSFDKTVRVWDAATLVPLGSPMEGHDQPISDVSFGVDGRTIVSTEFATTDGRGQTRTWPGPAAWSEELCKKLTANMSQKQWRDWVSPGIDYDPTCPDLQAADAGGKP
jgi:WD40 repeat protein